MSGSGLDEDGDGIACENLRGAPQNPATATAAAQNIAGTLSPILGTPATAGPGGTPLPTRTPLPLATDTSTGTLTPTATPQPAATLQPTATPQPTAIAIPAQPAGQLWLTVLAETQTLNVDGEAAWVASPEEWYLVTYQEPGWVLAFWEGDSPASVVWIEVDSRVELLIADRPLPVSPAPQPEPQPETPPEAGLEPAIDTATILAPPGFTGALLRSDPFVSARTVELVPNGTEVEILEGFATADGFRWLRVRTPGGEVGWIASETIGR